MPTIHEEKILQVIRVNGSPMTTTEIDDALGSGAYYSMTYERLKILEKYGFVKEILNAGVYRQGSRVKKWRLVE